MTVTLRIILVLVSLITTAFMLRKIHKSQFKIEDSLFWIFFSIVLLVMSIFPKLVDWAAGLIGIYSTTNFVFAVFIFMLLIKIFTLTLKVSKLEHKLSCLAQKYGIDKNEESKKNGQK